MGCANYDLCYSCHEQRAEVHPAHAEFERLELPHCFGEGGWPRLRQQRRIQWWHYWQHGPWSWQGAWKGKGKGKGKGYVCWEHGFPATEDAESSSSSSSGWSVGNPHVA